MLVLSVRVDFRKEAVITPEVHATAPAANLVPSLPEPRPEPATWCSETRDRSGLQG
jgi:hypothetical protein